MREKRVLVTGCCGRLGRAAVRALLVEYRCVRGYDCSPCPREMRAWAGFEFVQGRAEDQAAVRQAVRDCDVVVHLAGCPDDADFESVLLPSNIGGTAALLQAIETLHTTPQAVEATAPPPSKRAKGTPPAPETRRVRRLVVASSGKLFAGHMGPYPISPQAAPRPVCAYGATKAFVEAAVEAFSRDVASGCPAVALRFGWCPRTEEDAEAMARKSAHEGQGRAELLTRNDAGSAIARACVADLPCLTAADPRRFKAYFVQSRVPPAVGSQRFDTAAAEAELGWEREPCVEGNLGDWAAIEPADTSAYTVEPRLRPRDDPAPGVFLGVGPDAAQSAVRQRVSAAEWALRVELAAAYRVFAMFGWTHSVHTHITVKVPPPAGEPDVELFLINPYGLVWEEITASSLVKVKADGGIVDNGSTTMPINPAGFKIHSAIHTSQRGKPGGDILWTMHTHTVETVAVSLTPEGLIPGLSQYAMDIGPVAYHDFEHATAGEHVCQQLVKDLGATSKVMLLRNHGCITVGKTVNDAFFSLMELIEACKVQVLSMGMLQPDAPLHKVPEDTVKATYKITQANYTGKPFGMLEWQAACRQMERLYGKAYKE